MRDGATHDLRAKWPRSEAEGRDIFCAADNSFFFVKIGNRRGIGARGVEKADFSTLEQAEIGGRSERPGKPTLRRRRVIEIARRYRRRPRERPILREAAMMPSVQYCGEGQIAERGHAETSLRRAGAHPRHRRGGKPAARRPGG